VRNLGIEVIERAGKQGLGSAYRAGFSLAMDRGYTYIIQMDADGSHQVNHHRLPLHRNPEALAQQESRRYFQLRYK
ncbi:MAG: hypothetical protein RL568_907, partial [Actinomycetota bacterium]